LLKEGKIRKEDWNILNSFWRRKKRSGVDPHYGAAGI